MPWTAEDATKHNKGATTKAKKKKWAAVANHVLAESGDEGKAVRIANAAISHNVGDRLYTK